MNILVVSQYYYPEPFRINEICEELVKRGHEVTVLTANPNYPDGEIYDGYDNVDYKEKINGVTVYRCKCRPRHKGAVNLGLNYIDFVIQANKIIMKLDDSFDCIYAYQLSPVTSCLPAIKYKKKKRIPMFLYCLDVWPESLRGSALGNPIGLKVFGWISKYIYKSADKIAVTSPAFRKYISLLCDIDEEKISYIPQHSALVNCNNVEPAVLKDVKKTNFVFMGNIGESQNIECLLQALSHIKDRSKILFHIVGSGSRFEACKELAKKLKVEDAVAFYGRYPKSDMPKFYALADVCYVSLKNEGVVGSTIPGKVQEYMSAGKPILACMNGDTKTVLENAECGICVPAEDDKQLADAIVKMTENSVNIYLLGENSKRYYRDNFTIASHVDQLEKLIGGLIR